MKGKFWAVGAFGLLVGGFTPAMAGNLLEIRAGAGMNGSSPDDLNDQLNAALGGGMDAGSVDNYNLDVLFKIPVLSIHVGVRDEWISDSHSGWDMNVNNLTLLADWRILDNSLLYVGPIAGIGYPWGDLTVSGTKTNLDSKNMTLTLGGEAGVKFGRFILGAEAGYTSLKLKTSDGSTSVDLSGFYGKAMVGISFF